MRLYLDLCCLKRPLDDQSRERVRLETQAILIVLGRCDQGVWQFVSSDALDEENALNPDPDRRERASEVLARASSHVQLTAPIANRARALEHIGLGAFDALHLASAAAAGADHLLTTDDRFLARARRVRAEVAVTVRNPVDLIMEETK